MLQEIPGRLGLPGAPQSAWTTAGQPARGAVEAAAPGVWQEPHLL